METRLEQRENGNAGAVLWPAVIKVSCHFTKTAEGKPHVKYQMFWGNPDEPGPYTVQLLGNAQVLAQKNQVYGTNASLEADMPEETSCFVTVFPEGKEAKDLLPVPAGPVCQLKEIICDGAGSMEENGLCSALRIGYAAESIVPETVTVQLKLSNGRLRLISLPPFENRILLDGLGIDGEESFKLGVGCTYQEQSAVISQEPEEEEFVSVCRKAPGLTGMSVELNQQKVSFCIGLAEEGAGSYEAVLYCDGAKRKAEAELSEDKKSLAVQIPFSDFPYGPAHCHYLSVVRKNGMVTLAESERLAVTLQKPAVETLCWAKKGAFRLSLSGKTDTKPQLCRATFKDGKGNTEKAEFADGKLEHTFDAWESVTLAWVNGKSTGPESDPVSLKIPAYLSGMGKDETPFIYYAENGMMNPGGAIRVQLSVKAVLKEAVQSGGFTLSPPANPGTEGAVLEIAETVWPDNQAYESEGIRNDCLKLFKAAETAGFDGEDLRQLRKLLALRLPQRINVCEQAFYRFDMRRRQCGLFPGMALLVESGRMQWSDAQDGSGYFAGISGAEQVRIPVVCRDKKVGLDAFLVLLTDYAERFEQPDTDNQGILPGGAGTVDLGRDMLHQTHLAVHYPENFMSHCVQGDVKIRNNECVAAAESLEIMDRDIQLLETQGYLEEAGAGSQAYFVFLRGRVHMTPCFAIWMEGAEHWAAVGTTVGDMMDRYGKTFYLMRNGAKAAVPMLEESVLRSICLFPGDCLLAEA